MVINAQRTLFGVDLNLCTLFNKPYTILPNTSLNEKFNILSDVVLETNTYPTLQYYTIGIGGSNIIDDNNTYSYSEHSPLDGALFEHIPFIMRPIYDDISITEQSKYRFRIIETHDGEDYVCYYLKVIPQVVLRDFFYNIKTKNGLSTLHLLDTNTADILNPLPKDRTVTIDNIDTLEYVAKTAKLEFSLYKDDLEDIISVMTILNKPNTVLTEIGICSGVDVTEDGVTEASCVQILFHSTINIDFLLAYNNNDSIIKAIELGGSEPMVR